MKVMLVGKDASDLSPLLERFEFSLVDSTVDAEAIIAYGGDGALIGAEYDYPGVPKMGIRDNKVCAKCALHQDEAVLQRLRDGEAETTDLLKLDARLRDESLLGLNDVFLRNRDVRSAVRFIVYINGEQVTDEVIGDGLVAATPFGSSAYFRSITNLTFRNGIGLAFNNCTEFVNHLVLSEDDTLRVHIVRGPAELTADNNPQVVKAESGDDIVIEAAAERARILAVDTLRCSHCRYRHAPRRRF